MLYILISTIILTGAGVVLLVRPSIDRLREDVFGLQERMTRLERRIDELEGSLDVLRDLFVANNR